MHYSVLLKESIDGLNIKDGGTYVDCTLGYAGHSKVILEKNKKGKLFAFDEDENAPGALLSKLSIDTTQLTPLTLTIFGDAIQTIGVIITGFALGFSYDWRLTLMALCFVPFIIASQIVVNQADETSRKSVISKNQR